MTEEPAGKAGLLQVRGSLPAFCALRVCEILKTLEIRPVGLLSRVLAGSKVLHVHASMSRVTLVAEKSRPPDFCALRACEILKTLEIRPVGLLSRVLAGSKVLHVHASMKCRTFEPWGGIY